MNIKTVKEYMKKYSFLHKEKSILFKKLFKNEKNNHR